MPEEAPVTSAVRLETWSAELLVVRVGMSLSQMSTRRADAVCNQSAILGAARQLVAEQGTDVAMGEIARAVGVAVGMLHRHFPTKADLLTALVGECAEEGADAAEELLVSLGRALDMIARSHATKAVAQALGAQVEYGEAEIRATRALGRLVEVGRANGGLRPDLAVFDIYNVMVLQPSVRSVGRCSQGAAGLGDDLPHLLGGLLLPCEEGVDVGLVCGNEDLTEAQRQLRVASPNMILPAATEQKVLEAIYLLQKTR